jgi:hypothetical protein
MEIASRMSKDVQEVKTILPCLRETHSDKRWFV